MIPVALNLRDRNVLIVGGGKVALRQTIKFLQQHARVTVVSPEFLADFQNLHIHRIDGYYQPHYLKDVFLVYTATSDRDINHKIVRDCIKNQILCGSATKDEEATFYGMSYQENEVGMVAYSSHQQFPYTKPLINEFMTVVEKNKTRLQLLSWLRPYVLKLPDYHKDLFVSLYAAPVALLQFLADSIKCGHGVIVIYHRNKFDNSYDFDFDPVIYLSIEEFQLYQQLFMFDVRYVCFPLVMADGIIYQKMTKNLSSHIINAGAVIQSREDVNAIAEMLKENCHQIWILHNRQNSWLKEIFKQICSNCDIDIYDFNETFQLDRHDRYELRILILGHGKHYHDCQMMADYYLQQGYDIEFAGNLLDSDDVKTYIVNRIKAFINQKM